MVVWSSDECVEWKYLVITLGFDKHRLVKLISPRIKLITGKSAVTKLTSHDKTRCWKLNNLTQKSKIN